MILIRLPKLDKAIRFFLALPRWMGENPFLGFLVLLLIALGISSLVFYQYVFLLRDAAVESTVIETRFNEKAFERVMQELQQRQEAFTQTESFQGRDILAPSVQNEELTE